jgi:hypothetical protein
MCSPKRVKRGWGKAKNGALRVAQIDRQKVTRKDVFGGVQGNQPFNSGHRIIGGQKDTLVAV